MNIELTNKKTGYKKTKLGLIPDDWKIIALGELYDFKNGLNKEKEFFGYGTPIINYMDVFNYSFLSKDKIKGKVFLTENEIKRFNIKKGDVFFTRTSETVNEIAYSSVLIEDIDNGVFSGFVLRARPKSKNNIDLNFAQYCFSTQLARKEIISKSSFTTRALTNGRFLSEVNLLLPLLSEQQKIAKILSTWDTAIQKQEQLIAAKETFKKGLMQVLLTGKKRFEGFEDDWEEIKLGNLSNSFSGGTPSRAIKEYYNGSIPWIKSGDLNRSIIVSVEENISEQALVNSSAKIVNKGTLLLAMYGATAGVVAITNIRGAINQAILAIETYNSLDKIFLYYLLKLKMPHYVHRLVQGGQPNLSGGIIKKLKFNLPSIPEQQKIAAVLTKSDSEVKVLNQQLQQLKDQRKGLMQQLLTGAIRVKTTKK